MFGVLEFGIWVQGLGFRGHAPLGDFHKRSGFHGLCREMPQSCPNNGE